MFATLNLTGEAWLSSQKRRRRDQLYVGLLLPFLAPMAFAGLGWTHLLDGRGAVFTQQRVGRADTLFTIYKIRTQLVEGIATPLGRVLRFCSIDELPQLYNVFSGDMSLFGPRPLMLAEWDEMEQTLPAAVFARWRAAYMVSGPGCISSYGHASRRGGAQWTPEQSMLLRAELDCLDFELASSRHDRRLLGQVASTALSLLVHPSSARY